MKNQSKEKATTPIAQNRLNKTQAPPKAVDNMDNTYYGQKKNIPQQPKPLPPRAGSTQKISYKIQDNMTHSKINEAKQGLQLLKKKMSRNGMSRQKNASIEKKQEYSQQPYSKKNIKNQNEEQSEYRQRQPKRPPNNKAIQKQPPRQQMNNKKSPPISSKSIEDRPIQRSNQPNNDYLNELQEVPIKANQDFFAILERQMAKEKGMTNKDTKAKKIGNYEQQGRIQLAQCSKGCGRQFNIQSIAKHQKICQKVFQSKRKAFDAAAQRAPQTQDIIQPPPQVSKKLEKPKKTQAEGKVPKWKLQSAAFRAQLKQGRGQQLSAEQKTASDQTSGMTQCSFCGRKFNAEAAKRHIPFCQKKYKQLPSMNTKKK